MATFKIHEIATEYRIEIVGKFTGFCVRDVEASWRSALQANLQRQVVVDISRIDGFDNAGRLLLRQMHKHGTVIAASTSHSLVFLEEVTTSRRGSTLLQEAPSPKSNTSKPAPSTRAAGGNK